MSVGATLLASQDSQAGLVRVKAISILCCQRVLRSMLVTLPHFGVIPPTFPAMQAPPQRAVRYRASIFLVRYLSQADYGGGLEWQRVLGAPIVD